MKKGQTSFMMEKVVNIIFAVLIILMTFMLVYYIWTAIYGNDKQAVNQYRTMGDLAQGVLESSDGGIDNAREFIFNFNFQADQKAFRGTIFGISSDGKLTSFIPPLPGIILDEERINSVNGGDAYALLPRAERARCTGRACLCLSLVKMDIKKAGDGSPFLIALPAMVINTVTGTNGYLANIEPIISGTEACRTLGTGDVALDFSSQQESLESIGWFQKVTSKEGLKFVTMTIWKDDCSQSTTHRDEDVCLFVNLHP